MEITRLFRVAESGNLGRVQYFIERKGVPANVTNEEQDTIAHVAVRNNNLDMLDYILDEDLALLTKTNNNDSTILQLAAELGAVDIVKYLIEKRDVKIFHKYMRNYDIIGTVIHRAIKYGHQNVVKYFIEERRFEVNVNLPLANRLDPPLLVAMMYRKTGIVRYLLEEAKAEPSALNSNQENVLFLALDQRNLNLMKYLLNKTMLAFNLNGRRFDGKTLVHMAVLKKDFRILEYLVEERNANVNLADADENTPLHYAVFKKGEDSEAYESTKYLIMHNADVNKKNRDALTPISLYHKIHFIQLPFNALYNNDVGFLKYLLEETNMKFNLNDELFDGKTLIETALESNKYDVVKYLVKEKYAVISPIALSNKLLLEVNKSYAFHYCESLIQIWANVKHRDANGNTILNEALRRGDEDGNTILHRSVLYSKYLHISMDSWCEYLVEQGCDVNQQNKKGERPLHLAASFGYQETCEYFITQGADINQKNYAGETPLHYAVSSRQQEICEYLIKQGADINRCNNKGETALHLTAAEGQADICNYLIQGGAAVNQKNKKAETALHLAAARGQQDICKYLIKNGADVNQKDDHGKSPLEFALDNYHQGTFKYLADYVDVNGSTFIHTAAERNQIIVVNYLVSRRNVDVNAPRNDDNWTPLHCAAFKKHSEAVRLLIEYGANIEAQDVNGKTPLQVVDNRRFMKKMKECSNGSRRGVGEFSRASTYRNSIRSNHQGMDENLVDVFDFGDFSVVQFQNFLTILHLVIQIFYRSVDTMYQRMRRQAPQ